MSDAPIPPPARLARRARIVQSIRAFFIEQAFIEVETPVRIATPALEAHIDPPASERAYLRTSPELHMKRLLCHGYQRIFQLGPCFRKGERGARHQPEFTMLEWYRAEADDTAIQEDAQALLRYVLHDLTGGTRLTYGGQSLDLSLPWPRLTVQEAYQRWAGWDPLASYDADRFDLDMVERIEPALPPERPCFLTDYPAPAAALARLRPHDPRIAARWELYLGGLELCNAFGELTDPALQRSRFEACARARARAGQPVYPLDERFLQALESGMPPSGGAALGVDRLVMLLCNLPDIRAIRAFCDEVP